LGQMRNGTHGIQCPVGVWAAVLGAALQNPDAFAELADLLSPDVFYEPRHRRIFRAMLELNAQGASIDPLAMSDWLKAEKQLEKVGGIEYLADLVNRATPNPQYHAQMIADYAAIRQLLAAVREIQAEAISAKPGDLPALLDRTQSRILDITPGRAAGDYSSVSELVMPTLDEIAHRGENPVTGLSTGLPALDELTGGLQPGSLIIVAGRPSMGKTALAVDLSRHSAIAEGVTVALFSIEMSGLEITKRLLIAESRVGSHRIRSKLTDRECERLAMAAGQLKQVRILIEDRPNLTPHQVAARARQMHQREGGLGLVIVDYLQLMQLDSSERRERAVAEASRRLKVLARELHVPVVVLSQLSRAPETREQHRPRLSDLRDSGAIEQDADLVIFAFRQEVYEKEGSRRWKDAQGKAELIVGKQRNGPLGTVRCCFRKQFMTFEEDECP